MGTKENNLSVQIGDPRFCDIVIATRCVLRCKMCKAWQGGQERNEITLEEAKRFVRSLSAFVKFPLEINVMGGEPFLKDWCLDLCGFINEQGFKSIISTNAYLIDEEMAKRIADSKLSVLAISLESLKAKTHDFYRGVEGVYAKVMRAIDYLDKYCRGKLTMTILTIIMEKNLDDIPELVEWVNRSGLFENVSFLALLETGLVHPRHEWFKRPEYAQLWPQDPQKTYRLIDELIRFRKKGYKIWNPLSQLEAFKEYYTDPDKFMRDTQYRVNDYIIDLDENGTIYLSGETLGNVRQDDVQGLWFSEKANQARNKISRSGPGQRCCVINFVCAFPPDEEYAKTMQGDQETHKLKQQGFVYLDQRKLGQAIAAFKAVLELDPGNAQAHHGLGLCHQYNKEFQPAIAALREAVRGEPGNEHMRHDLGVCYKSSGQHDKAIEELTAGLKINSRSELLRQSLGFCYSDLKQYDKAEKEFLEALALNPASQFGHLGLGFVYFEAKKIDRAMAEYRAVLELDPGNAQAHHGLGLCYQYNQRFDKAASEFGRVLEIDPNHRHVQQNLGFCYKDLKQFDQAICAFTQAIKLDPGNAQAHHGLGLCYQYNHQFDKAIAEFREELALIPDNEQAHYGLAYCYENIRQFDKAIAEFTQALRINPGSDLYYQRLGSCYEGLGRFDQAIGAFRKALEINPNNEYAPYSLASCYDAVEKKNNTQINPFIEKASRCAEEIERPDFCVIEVSHRCMFRCKMCNYGKKQDTSPEVSVEELRRFVSSMKSFVRMPFEMNISGGEPLLKEGVLDLVEFIAQQGVRFSLVTNGYLINRKVAGRIAESGLNFLAISLDSLDQKTHDFLRGKRGAYKMAMWAADYFGARRGKIENLTLQTIIMGPNLDGILDLAHWAQQKKLALSFMAITRPNMLPIDHRWYKDPKLSFLWPADFSKVERVIDTLITLKKSGYRIDNPVGQLERFKRYFSDPEKFVQTTPCSLGERILHVNPRGDMHICCEMEPIGNIKELDISAIWGSPRAQRVREQIRLCRRNCAEMVNCYREKAPQGRDFPR